MHNLRILLDLDGTVAENAGRRLASVHFGISLSEEVFGSDSMLDVLGISAEAFWEWWQANQSEIYRQALPLPGAADVLAGFAREGAHIAVVTARREEARAVTAQWLATHGFPCHSLHFAADDKAAIARSLGLNLAFEDDPHHALPLAARMPVVMMDGPKSRRCPAPHPQIYTAQGWSQVPALLRSHGLAAPHRSREDETA